MRSILLFIIVISTISYTYSQNTFFVTAPGSNTPSGTEPSMELFTCEASKEYVVLFDNFSPHSAQNITLNFTLPPGLVYDSSLPNSVSVTNNNSSTGTTTSFTSSAGSSNVQVAIGNMNTQDKAQIKFYIKATCGSYQHGSGNNAFTPSISVNYTPSSTGAPTSETYNLPDIDVRYPNLQMVVDNYLSSARVISYPTTNPGIGDTIFREIRIKNGGAASLSTFIYRAKNDDCLQIRGHNLGSLNSQTSGGYTFNSVVFNGTDFSTIGNGDNFFDPNEEIILLEEAIILCCNNPVTQHQLMWGCGSDICQFEKYNNGITFPPSSPRIIATPFSMVGASSSDTLCYGDFNAVTMHLDLKNVGSEFPAPSPTIDSAQDVIVDIYQGRNGFSSNMLSIIDVSTIQVINKNSGAILPYSTISSSPNSSAYCSGPNPANAVGRFQIKIDKLYANEEIRISWDVFSCNNNSCSNIKLGAYSWRYNVTYYNRCDKAFNEIRNKEGYKWTELQHSLTSLGSNPNNISGSSALQYIFKFEISQSDFNIPHDASDYLEYKIVIPPCMTFSPTGADIFLDDWLPSTPRITPDNISISPSNDTIYARFNDGFEQLEQWVLNVRFTSEICASCSTTGRQSVKVQSYYKATNSCGNAHALGCAESFYQRICGNCPGNISLNVNAGNKNGFARTSFGDIDSDDDGVSDGAGPTNAAQSGVRVDRASYGDIVTMTYDFENPNGRFLNVDPAFCPGFPSSARTPAPNFIYTYIKVSNASLFQLQSIDLNLSHSLCNFSSTTTTYTNVAHTSSIIPLTNDSSIINIELDINQLHAAGDWPEFVNTGQIKLNFEVISNPNVAVKQCPYEFGMFANNTAITLNTITNSNANFCRILNGNFDIIGYRYASYARNYFNFHSCDNVEVSERYRFNVGVWFEGMVGTNYYPNEYRPYSYVDTLIASTTNEYRLVSAELNYYRTNGVNSQELIPFTDIMPHLSSPLVGSNFKFNVGDLFRLGTFPQSDEGYMGDVKLVFEPTCATEEIPDTINYNWVFNESSMLAGSNTSNTESSNDIITYQAPDIIPQTTQQTAQVIGTNFSWIILIPNNSNISTAQNSWFAIDNAGSTIVIDKVERIDGSQNTTFGMGSGTASDVNGIYQMRRLDPSKFNRIKISAHLTTCNADSVKLLLGYDCDGYPSSINNILCPVEEMMLYAEPKFPTISNVITASNNPVDLCDDVTYTIKVENSGLGIAYNVLSKVSLPLQMTYVVGSAEIYDPNNSSAGWVSFVPNQAPGALTFDIDNLIPLIGSNGLIGITNPSKNYVKIRFKVTTDCGFVSGTKIQCVNEAVAACNRPFTSQPFTSEPYLINGAIATHQNQIIIDAGWLTPCDTSTPVQVKIINLGPINNWVGDSITVVLPNGIHYKTGSYDSIQNVSSAPPVITSFGNKEYLRWELSNLVANTDTAKFGFQILSQPDSIKSCINQFMQVYTTNEDNAICSSTGLGCKVNVLTGDTLEPLFVEKGSLLLANASAFSIPNPTTGEKVYVNFDIDNIGPAINGNINGLPNGTVVSYFDDIDGTNTYTLADTLLVTDTIWDTIPNGTYSYNDSLLLPAGKACKLLVVLDYLNNPCICSSSEILIPNVSMITNEEDDSVCALIPTPIGYEDSITRYNYSWRRINLPGAGGGTSYLNDDSTHNPIITAPNPIGGIDTLTYEITIDRINCTTLDTINVIITSSPLADAGADDSVCLSSYNLDGNIPLVVPGIINTTGEWTVDNSYGNGGSSSIRFIDSSIYNTTVTGLEDGLYRFIWTLDNGFCEGTPDTMELTVFLTDYLLGNDTILCNQNNFTVTAPSLSTGYTGNWSFTSNSATGAIISSTTTNTTTINGLLDGEYELEWEVTAPNGLCTYKDSIKIYNYIHDTAYAGSDSAICGVFNFNLWADSLINSNIGTWSIDSSLGNANNISISDINKHNSLVAFADSGNYTLVWTSISGPCDTTTDSVNISISNIPVSSTPDTLIICNEDTLLLTANVPLPNEIGRWKALATNPSIIAFDDDSSPNTIARNFINGTYKLVWIVDNAVCDSVTDTLTVISSAKPIISAGADSNSCETTSIQLSATPIGLIEKGKWRQLDGNAPVNFVSINSPTSLVTGLSVNNYEFEWSVTNGICDTAYDTVNINIFEAPIADGGTNISYCDTNEATLRGNILTTMNYHTYEWSFNSSLSQASNSPIIVNPDSIVSEIRNLEVGIYAFVLEATNGYCDSVTDTVYVTIHANPVVNYTATPNTICEGDCIEFNDASSVTDSSGSVILTYSWTFGNGNSSDNKDVQECYTTQGEYDISLEVTTDKGCRTSIIVPNDITVNPNPVADFNYIPNVNITPELDITIEDLSSGAVGYKYSFGDGNTDEGNANTSHAYADTGIYELKQLVTNEFGCTDSIIKLIEVKNQVFIVIPNSFTPNNDNVNDVLSPVALGIEQDSYTFSVFNRWGQLVFSSKSIEEGWDGKHKGRVVPDGNYVWKISFKEKDGVRIFERTGHVTVFK